MNELERARRRYEQAVTKAINSLGEVIRAEADTAHIRVAALTGQHGRQLESARESFIELRATEERVWRELLAARKGARPA